MPTEEDLRRRIQQGLQARGGQGIPQLQAPSLQRQDVAGVAVRGADGGARTVQPKDFPQTTAPGVVSGLSRPGTPTFSTPGATPFAPRGTTTTPQQNLAILQRGPSGQRQELRQRNMATEMRNESMLRAEGRPDLIPGSSMQERIEGRRTRIQRELQTLNFGTNQTPGQLMQAHQHRRLLEGQLGELTGQEERIHEAEQAELQHGRNLQLEGVKAGLRNPTDRESRTRMLSEIGVDPEVAQGIAAGLYQVSRHPITGQADVIRLDTGQTVGQMTPEQAEAAEQQGSGQQGRIPIIRPGADAQEAAGAMGFVRNAVNVLSDAFGQGAQFPQAQEATNALKMLDTLTRSFLQAEIPGRPSNLVMELIGDITIDSNSIFTGSDKAKTQIEDLARFLDGEIERIEVEVLDPNVELQPAQKAAARLNKSQLQRLSQAYRELLNNFGSSRTGVPAPDRAAPEGADAELWRYMTPEERDEYETFFQ